MNKVMLILLFGISSVSAQTTYLECSLSGKETSITNGKTQEIILPAKTLSVEVLINGDPNSIQIKGSEPYDILVLLLLNGTDSNYTDSNKFHMKSYTQLKHQSTNILSTSEIQINRITGYLVANRVFTMKNQSTHSNIFTSLTGSCRKLENTRKF
jgi:hypothetical protein